MKSVTELLLSQKFIALAGVAATLLAAAALLLPPSPLRLAAAILLTGLLPGLALTEAGGAWLKLRQSPLERLLLGLALSYSLTIIATLWLYYAGGAVSLLPLGGLLMGVSVAGFAVAAWRGDSPAPTNPNAGRVNGWLLALLLLLAGYFSLAALAYSDFRGDEAEVVLRAVEAIKGAGQPILSHTKGPAEITLTAAVGVLYGAFSELSARLPFALANWAGLLAAYLLGARLFGPRVGLLTLLLLTLNGWLVSHSRTAQYQTIILLMSTASVWAYYRFYQTQRAFFPLAGGMFLAAALLSHYDGASVGPAILYLLWLLRREANRAGRPVAPGGWWAAVGSLLLAAGVALTFYLPFALNPARSDVEGHFWRNFGAEQPYNNWDTFYVNGLYYNSSYYVLGIGLLLFVGSLRGFYLAGGGGRRGALTLSLTAPLLLLSWTGLLPPWYAALVYAAMMTIFIAAAAIKTPVKLLLWWILLPLGLYLFLVIRPGNHYYVVMPPLLLLAALTLAWLWGQLSRLPRPARSWARAAAGVSLAGWLGLSAWYQHAVFMQTNLEYMLTYPAHRNPVFLSDPRYPFDIRIGWGFPYRLGWQTISEMYRRQLLAGDWYGNDENNSIEWYTLGWPRNPCYPQYFMLTTIGYEEPPLSAPRDTIDQFYQLTAVVEVNDQERLKLFEFNPTAKAAAPVVYEEPATFSTPYTPELFRRSAAGDTAQPPERNLPGPVSFKPHPAMLAAVAESYGDPRITQVRDQVALLDYDLDLTWAQPGGALPVTLTWQAVEVINLPYKIFIHLADARGQLVAQSDDIPNCGAAPTNTWRVGLPVSDRHMLRLPADLPPGPYTLTVGLYEPQTGIRLDVLDGLGNPQGVELTLPPIILPNSEG